MSLINKQNVRLALLRGEGVKKVSAETVAWVDQVVAEVCKNLAASGRRSATGILMAPKMHAGLQARTMVKEHDAEPAPLPERLCHRAKQTLAENGGERPSHPFVLVEVSGGTVQHVHAVGNVLAEVVDYDDLNLSIGDPNRTSDVEDAAESLRELSRQTKDKRFAESAEEILKRHSELCGKAESKWKR